MRVVLTLGDERTELLPLVRLGRIALFQSKTDAKTDAKMDADAKTDAKTDAKMDADAKTFRSIQIFVQFKFLFNSVNQL
jgi:hypothetical protein